MMRTHIAQNLLATPSRRNLKSKHDDTPSRPSVRMTKQVNDADLSAFYTDSDKFQEEVSTIVQPSAIQKVLNFDNVVVNTHQEQEKSIEQLFAEQRRLRLTQARQALKEKKERKERISDQITYRTLDQVLGEHYLANEEEQKALWGTDDDDGI